MHRSAAGRLRTSLAVGTAVALLAMPALPGRAGAVGPCVRTAGQVVDIAPTQTGNGYWLTSSRGGVDIFGDATSYGDLADLTLNRPIVGVVPSNTASPGYYLQATDGGVYVLGDLPFLGSAANQGTAIVDMVLKPGGGGYWQVAPGGRVFQFGSAVNFGYPAAGSLSSPVVGMAARPNGLGYWLVTETGRVLPFGDAPTLGSATGLTSKVVAMAASPTGLGYWLVTETGTVLAFGDAPTLGSAAGLTNKVVAMAARPSGLGYWLVTETGTVLAFGDAPVLGSCAVGPAVPARAYVTNLASSSVSVIDTATNTVTATVAVGTGPTAVAISPNGARAYVIHAGNASVSVIDTATNTVTATVAVGSSPYAVAITPDGGRAYVANVGSNNVSVIDTATNTVSTTVAVGSWPAGVAITPNGAQAYVANAISNSVSVIDTATNTVSSTVAVGGGPHGVAITPNGVQAYVTNNFSNSVSVIDIVTNTVTATVAVGGLPIRAAITPNGARVYVTNANSGSVSVIDTATNTVTATVGVGSEPVGVAIAPDSTRAYVANHLSDNVSVIDTATNTVTATVVAGAGPYDVAVGPGGEPSSTPPVASFTASPTSGGVPLPVTFTDTSTGNPTSFSWNFGDGSPASQLQNPTHTYSSAGTFTVTETVTNSGGSDSTTATITVVAPPSLAISPPSGRPGTVFLFPLLCPNPAVEVRAPDGKAYGTGTDDKAALALSLHAPVPSSGKAQAGREGTYTVTERCGTDPPLSGTFEVKQDAPYAALGDSYSSGEGAMSFDILTDYDANRCHRSSATAYGPRLAAEKGLTVDFGACSGAYINDFLKFNISTGLEYRPALAKPRNADEIPQLFHISPRTTRLVTLTIGGNDVGFPDILTDCVVGPFAPGFPSCETRSNSNDKTTNAKLLTKALGWLEGKGRPAGCSSLPGIRFDTGQQASVCGPAPSLHELYKQAAMRIVPGGTLVVAGYPQLFRPAAKGLRRLVEPVCYVAPGYWIENSDVAWLNAAASKLNGAIKREAELAAKDSGVKSRQVKIVFAPVDKQFDGHRLCDKGDSWINGLQFVPKTTPPFFEPNQTSFHPNEYGQAAYRSAVRPRVP